MKTSSIKCLLCMKKISDTVQDNHGKGWAFANGRLCNSCYERVTK